MRELVLDEQLKPRAGRMYWAGREPPAPRVGLRTGSSVEFRLVGLDDDGDERLIGTVDSSRVFHVAHPGALYLHQGRQWRVDRLDLDDHVAWLEPADDADEYTQTREDTDISITGEDERVPCGAGWAHLGSVDVTNTILAYQRKRASTNATIEVVPLDLPPRTLPTRACWYTLSDVELLAVGIEPHQVLGAVHAAEHALIGLLPLFTICDRWDVGGVSMALHPRTLRADDLRLRRLPRRRRHRRAGLRRARTPHPRGRRARRPVPVRRRVPVVRAVTQVRELERVPRQGRRPAPAQRARRRPGPVARAARVSRRRSPASRCSRARS